MKRIRAGLPALTIALCGNAPISAGAAGNGPAGQALAQRWCSACHAVDRVGPASDTAPAFSTIARTAHRDDAWLRAWLTDPHPPMPNFQLSRQQIDDIMAYLGSLAAP